MAVKQSTKRYEILDALKGFAMIGVIIVNAATMNGPYWMDMSEFAFQRSSFDALVEKICFIFLIPPMYPLFPLSFGMGLSLMIDRLKERSCPVISIFLKRTILLALIGLLHITLFFWGDVLFVYAILGVVLLLITRLDYKKTCVFSLGLFLLTAIINGLLQGQESLEEDNEMMASIYLSESFFILAKQRLTDYYEWYLSGIFQAKDFLLFIEYAVYYIELLAFMTTGLTIAQYQRHFDIGKFQTRTLLKGIVVLAVSAGLLKSGEYWFPLFIETLSSIKSILLALLYSAVFIIFYLNAGRNCQQIFSAMGRMSLTWYLMASFLMSLILHGHGFGFYGKIGPFETTIIATLYLIFCFSISPFWLRKFRHGPIEAMWRRLAY